MSSKIAACAVLSALLVLANLAHAEADERAAVLALARETIAAARYCALITVDESGQPRARTVEPFAPDDDFTIWIATRPGTRKVAQIETHSRVTLYYFDEEHRNYVTVMGHARLVDDPAIKRSMRRPADSDRLYPNFPEDYLLIAVTPSWLEAIVPGYRGDPVTWAPAAVDFR